MKNIILLFLLTLFSCNQTNDFYQGRVIDYEHNSPLAGVIVVADLGGQQTKTDKNGYFKLYTYNFLGHLIFVKKGYGVIR